jgi:hypothetical protein
LIPTNPTDERITPGPGYDRFTDQHLLRFLRARKFDVERARVMWEGCEKWRREFGADDVAR